MQDFYRFASDSPFLTFFLAWLGVVCVTGMLRLVCVLFRGWPDKKKDNALGD